MPRSERENWQGRFGVYAVNKHEAIHLLNTQSNFIKTLFRLIVLLFIQAVAFGGSSPQSSSASVDNTLRVFPPLVQNSTPDEIEYYLDQMDLARMTSITSNLVNLYGPRHHDFKRIFIDDQCTIGGQSYPNHNLIRASKYVFHGFEELGYNPGKEFVPEWHDSFNVVAQKIGSVYPNTFIEISAHVDSVDTTPGASDNAGSVAAMIEIARVLKDYQNRHSLRFIAFVGEENHLRGSRHHADRIVANGETIKAGLVMDGIGWSEKAPDHMNCLWDNGDAETRHISNLFNTVRLEYDIDIDWRLCDLLRSHQWSDNYAYWEHGLPAVLSIGGQPYADPNYHGCTDTMSSIDMQNVYLTALENLAVALKLDAEETQPDAYQAGESTAPALPEGEGISH